MSIEEVMKKRKVVPQLRIIPHEHEFRILVTGSRDWPETEEGIAVIRKKLTELIVEHKVDYKDVLVIVGGAGGVDTIVENLCKNELGIACAVFPAPWESFRKKHGNPRSAGPIRNGWMIRFGVPHYALAIHPYLINSKGTKNCVEQLRKAGVPVRKVEKMK